MTKSSKDENFPVGKFIRKVHRPIIMAYYKAAREADDVADSSSLSISDKERRLDILYKDFMSANSGSSAGELGKLFVSEQLDYRLYAELLEAFRKDIKGFVPEIWEQLLDYCHYSSAPVGRFILALHNQDPATYLPAEILCAVLQITNHLQDIKSDACFLRRCYIPQEILQKYQVRVTDFCLNKSSEAVKSLILDLSVRLQAMLDDAKILISLITDRRLRCEVAVIFSLTNSMLKKITKGDVLVNVPYLSGWDWLKATIYGIGCGIFVRGKPCSRIK